MRSPLHNPKTIATAADAGKRWGGRAALALNAALGSRAHDHFGVLVYHRVIDPPPGVPAPTYNVTPERLRGQLGGLIERGHRFISLNEAIEASGTDLGVPRNAVVVTFDDGYENVYANAWPILRELGIPASVLVTSAYLDGDEPFPFDPWGVAQKDVTAANAWRPLRWAQCREMTADGLIDIGSHTDTHRDLRRDPGAFESDLRASIARIDRNLRPAPRTFSFPYGRTAAGFVSDDLLDSCRRAGVTAALTTEIGLPHTHSTPWGWGRLEATSWDTAATLNAKLAGWYAWMGLARDRFTALRSTTN